MKGNNTIPITVTGDVPELPCVPPIMEITVKNTATPITSSIAARGISVWVTGPSVWYSLTMDKAGAGAVANAIPPKIKAG